MNRTTIPRSLCGCVVAISLMLAGCGASDEDERASATSTAQHPSQMDPYTVSERIRGATIVWSAEPEIDLFSTEGILIRANIESSIIARLVGRGYTYPGFDPSIEASTTYINFDPTGQLRKVILGNLSGTAHARIQSITETESGFESVVCIADHGLKESRDGKYYPSGLALDHGSAIRSYYTRSSRTTDRPSAPTTKHPTRSTAPPPEKDMMSWQAPSENYFSGWRIGTFAETDGKLDPDRCAPWTLSIYPDAPLATSYEAQDAPPVVLPAYPGWPDV